MSSATAGHARGWKHAKRDREQEDEDDPEPEDGYRKADRAEEAQEVIERAAAPQRLDQADRDAERDRERERGAREHQRVR